MNLPEDPDWLSPEQLEIARQILEGRVERRDFLRMAGKWAGGLLLAGALGSIIGCGAEEVARTTTPVSSPASAPAAAARSGADLAVAHGTGDPGALARKAIDAIGGMGRFVKQGNVVVIKPNASFMDGPQGGTSTHPSVVSEVISMCKQAGASRVIVTDHCLRGDYQTCFERNGIGAAARAAGGEVIAYGGSDSSQGRATPIPGGVAMRQASIYPLVLDADVFITVPKAKHHSGAGLSLGMKNLIGVTANMSRVHSNGLYEGIADIASVVRPDLSVIDASIVLTTNGPGGPGQVKDLGTVIASSDFVAADSYACTLFGMTASSVGYVAAAGRRGLGQVDFNTLKIANV